MRYQGSIEVNAKKEVILNFLGNIELVASCFPGIKDVKKDGDAYIVKGTAGIGFIKGDYTAKVKMQRTNEGFDLEAQGTGMNSNVNINAKIVVEDGRINYTADVNVSGILASAGARLMEPALNKILNQLFDCIKKKVEIS
ncbi:carbon monoxide dehydrogenase [Acidianus infernus]|uniref:Carbon monoxide dehydrogenase n=1 Tax=Acidianus infernus TaxID=12915 RepID=A0A6A9QDV6_ACIIN|nr:SRPBCC domain-containing protein [Acidianus infernus]MCY0874415.1 SRPBCC domain-containing protein [Acidianus infernus]MUM65432.1 carbon monoxide dehydrogenase [Acidianus infernus]